MPDEHESAVAAWLDNEDTKREIAVIQQRYEYWPPYYCVLLALGVEILANLNMYDGETTVIDTTADPDALMDLWTEEDEEDERWKK